MLERIQALVHENGLRTPFKFADCKRKCGPKPPMDMESLNNTVKYCRCGETLTAEKTLHKLDERCIQCLLDGMHSLESFKTDFWCFDNEQSILLALRKRSKYPKFLNYFKNRMYKPNAYLDFNAILEIDTSDLKSIHTGIIKATGQRVSEIMYTPEILLIFCVYIHGVLRPLIRKKLTEPPTG
jgi:hypothetical protein